VPYRTQGWPVRQTRDVFVPHLRAADPSDGPALVVVVQGSRIALGDVPDHGDGLFLGTLSGRHCWAVDADDGLDVALEMDLGQVTYSELMSMWGQIDETIWVIAGRAVQLVEWARTHRFCGRCGAETVESEGERSRRCPVCGLLAFPRLAPAIITLIERDDGRALLARNARWPMEMYSCLAGFVEPGETLEEAVRREVLEEVGIQVGELRYRRSQPWPFPHSLMIGFNAAYESGDIVCDEGEIAEARWFASDDLPSIPGPMSIARWLIDDWIARST
jgi:NAD+ diphosphatase